MWSYKNAKKKQTQKKLMMGCHLQCRCLEATKCYTWNGSYLQDSICHKQPQNSCGHGRTSRRRITLATRLAGQISMIRKEKLFLFLSSSFCSDLQHPSNFHSSDVVAAKSSFSVSKNGQKMCTLCPKLPVTANIHGRTYLRTPCTRVPSKPWHSSTRQSKYEFDVDNMYILC